MLVSDLDKVDAKNDKNIRLFNNDSPGSGPRPVGNANYRPPVDAVKCFKCQKSVGLVEQRVACNKIWHSDCFTCGGLQNEGCHKKLTLDGYSEHNEDPYCKTCYGKSVITLISV